jgi:hypothetical protein
MFSEGFQLTSRIFDRLLLSLLLTVVFNFYSFASQSTCIDFYLGLPHPSPAEAKQMWQSKYLESVSIRYQKGWSEWGYRYGENLWKMKMQGSMLPLLLEKFGFEIAEHRLSAPTAEVFIRNYENYLNEMGIPEGERIRPALGLVGNPRGPFANEIKLLTPGIDKWPENPYHWQMNYDLRLDPRILPKFISEGRFPLFSNGIHDVLHLVLFALHPEYAAQLRNQKSRSGSKANWKRHKYSEHSLFRDPGLGRSE